MEADVEGVSWDGNRCRGSPIGMEADVEGVPWGWKQMM